MIPVEYHLHFKTNGDWEIHREFKALVDKLFIKNVVELTHNIRFEEEKKLEKQ